MYRLRIANEAGPPLGRSHLNQAGAWAKSRTEPVEGSALLEAATILPHERIDIWNITNGAAARHIQTGDRVIIAAFAQVNEVEARQSAPSAVRLNDHSEVVTGIA